MSKDIREELLEAITLYSACLENSERHMALLARASLEIGYLREELMKEEEAVIQAEERFDKLSDVYEAWMKFLNRAQDMSLDGRTGELCSWLDTMHWRHDQIMKGEI